MQVRGTVDNIYTKQVSTKFGEKQVYHAVVDGNDINLGFKQLYSEGEFIDVQVEPKYGSLQIIQGGSAPVQGQHQAQATSSPPRTASRQATGFPVDLMAKDHSIIRQNSLNHATQIVKNAIDAGTLKAPKDLVEYRETVISVAYSLTEFSTGQREVRAANGENPDATEE